MDKGFVTGTERLCELPILCSTEPIGGLQVDREPGPGQLFPKQTAGPTCRFAAGGQGSVLADAPTSVLMMRAAIVASFPPISRTVGGTT